MATPLGTWTFPRGDRVLNHRWGSVMFAGATAWRPALVGSRVRPSIAGLTPDHVAYRPGYQAVSGWSGRSAPLVLEGDPQIGAFADVAWPDDIDSTEVIFTEPQPRVAHPEAPVRAAVDRKVAGLSVLQATRLGWDGEQQLRQTLPKAGTGGGAPVAALVVRYADGTEVERLLHFGVDTEVPDGDLRRTAMWGAAAVARLASTDAAALGALPGEGDLRLYRLDWTNPRPDAEVAELRIESRFTGPHMIVGAAEALLP